MNAVNYMQNNGGNIVMYCDQLPDNGFLDAVKVRNICAISLKNKPRGKNAPPMPNDVEVTSATGEHMEISRQQLINEYMHCNGKRVKLIGMRNGKKYFVYNIKDQGKTYKFLRIPNNCRGILNSRIVPPGYYIIAQANEDGTINRETISTISPKMFKRTFKVPIQTAIKRHIGKSPNQQFGLFNPNRLAEVRGYHRQSSVSDLERSYSNNMTSPQHQISLGTGPVSMPNIQNIQTQQRTVQPQQRQLQPQQRQVQQRPNQMQQRQAQQPQQNQQAQQAQQGQQGQNNLYRFTITHRVLGATNKALLGYVVKEISTGKSRQLPTDKVMMLCERKLVDNVMLVRRENGMRFLKGNNMRIEALPFIIG